MSWYTQRSAFGSSRWTSGAFASMFLVCSKEPRTTFSCSDQLLKRSRRRVGSEWSSSCFIDMCLAVRIRFVVSSVMVVVGGDTSVLVIIVGAVGLGVTIALGFVGAFGIGVKIAVGLFGGFGRGVCWFWLGFG